MEGNLNSNTMMGTSYAIVDLQNPIQIPHHQNPNFGSPNPNPNFINPFTQIPESSDQHSAKAHLSDEEETMEKPSEDGSNYGNKGAKKGTKSTWQRMKWTDAMVRLLITAVSYTGEDTCTTDTSTGTKRKFTILQKKGKWKAISKVLVERGCYVSPQQCEDKFNDLNKRYKRLTDILGRGTSCKVVENPLLLDRMYHVSDKLKEDVKKILSSKHLFYEEMCSYHNGNRLSLPADPALQKALQLALRSRDENESLPKREVEIDEEENVINIDNDDDDDDDDDDVDEEEEDENDGFRGFGNKRMKEDANINNRSNPCCGGSNRTKGRLDMNQALVPVPEASRSDNCEKLQLERRKLQIQAQMLELERQRFKWERFSKKKERELQRMKMQNEKMRLENERMSLELKHKELDLDLRAGFHSGR